MTPPGSSANAVHALADGGTPDTPAQRLVYPRILLKLSGEALMGEQGYGLDASVLHYVAGEVAQAYALGVQLAIVVGGGNILRGKTAAATGMDAAQADYMGMLATVINALALQDAIEHTGITARVQTAIPMAPGSPMWMGAPCIDGNRDVTWTARTTSCAGMGRMLTTIGPSKTPAFTHGMLVRNIGTLHCASMWRTGIPFCSNARSKVKLHPSRNPTISSVQYDWMSSGSSTRTPFR